MSWTIGPFRVVSVTPHTLAIYKNEIFNTVTIDRASTAQSRTQKNRTMQLKTAEGSLATDLQEADCSEPRSTKEYSVDRIKRHKINEIDIHYKDRWYRMHLRDGIHELARNIPQHFIHHY